MYIDYDTDISSCEYDLVSLNLHTDLQYDDNNRAQKYRTTTKITLSKKVYDIIAVGPPEITVDSESSLLFRVNGGPVVELLDYSGSTFFTLIGKTINPLNIQGTKYNLITEEYIIGEADDGSETWSGWNPIDWTDTDSSILPEVEAVESNDNQWRYVNESLDIQNKQSNSEYEESRKIWRISMDTQHDTVSFIDGISSELFRYNYPEAGFNGDTMVTIDSPDDTDWGTWVLTDWELKPYGKYGGGLCTESKTFDINSKWSDFIWE